MRLAKSEVLGLSLIKDGGDVHRLNSPYDQSEWTFEGPKLLDALGGIWNRKAAAKLSRLGNQLKEPVVMSSTIVAINHWRLIPDRMP